MPALMKRIEDVIASGHLAPGDRLPAERQLAADMGVSRSRLREAIKQMVSAGRLVSRQGGGTYVAGPDEAAAVSAALLPLVPLARSEAGYWRDVMEIRKSLEGEAARLAALRANEEDRAQISAAYEAVAEAFLNGAEGKEGPARLARLDAAFHMTIARSTHNAVLHQVMVGLEGLLEQSISESLAQFYRLPGILGQLDAQHRRIVDAVLAARPEEAHDAARDHLLFVEGRLHDIEDATDRRRRSSRALADLAPHSLTAQLQEPRS
jgi:GntR family L-lactate dehydrogenase operon transcriptional regulator